MKQKRLLLTIFCVALTLLVSASAASSQSIVTGGIAGVVTDPTGAVVVGAKLTLKSVATGETLTAVSAASGDYVFALLKPGEYSLSIAKEGFKTAVRNVTVVLGTTVSASVTLEVGTSSMTVEVTGEAGAQLETQNANISSNYETQQIQEVPNPGGDITYIALTAPGVTMNSSTVGGYGNFSTFGLPGTANLFTVNGNDYNDPFLNLNNSGSSNLLLGMNDLQEVSVINNGYTGQYGRQAGSQVDYTTKSGTNSWHGNAIYNWTGRELNANDPILKATSLAAGTTPTRPFENNNQWMASLGGPIIKDKLFFFLDNEGTRYIFGAIHPVYVPTPAFQTYVMNNLPTLGLPSAELAPTEAFYNNVFKLWNSAPGISGATAVPGSCSSNSVPVINNDQCTETWTDSSASGNKEWLLIARIDYRISDNDQIFGRMKFDRGLQPTYTDTINPAFDTFSNQPQNEGQINYTHIFSPTVTNNFIGNVLYYSAIFGAISPNSPALNLIPGNLVFTDGSLTNLGFGAGTGGYANDFFFPQGRNSTQWGLVDDLSVIRGNHAFKMGVNFRRNDLSDHTAGETTVYPAVQTTLAGFLDDAALSGVNYNFATSVAQPIAFYSLGLYFQDEYRATSKLRLTMTLRADRNSGGVCQHKCAGRSDVPFPDLQTGPDIPYNQSYLTGLKTVIPNFEAISFEPRFGVAYTPWGDKTVIRGGVGLFTDLYPGVLLSQFDTNFPQVNLWNIPFTNSGSLAWDLNSPTAFPTSGVAAVAQCNTAFTQNYYNGGSYNDYVGLVGAGSPCLVPPTIADPSNNLRNPKYLEWNLEVQRQLTPKTILSVNYVGNHGFDELYENDYLNGFGYGTLPATPADPRVGRVNYLESGAISNYHGLTVSLQQNAWHGLSGRLNYTYSHSLDDVSNGGVNPFTLYYSILTQINPASLASNYASSDYDARHQISASYIYELPFKSRNRWLNLAIGGWQLSGTQFWRTGFPFTFMDGAQAAGLAGNNLTGATFILQPEFSKRNFSNVTGCVISSCFGIVGGVNSTAPYLFAPATNFTNPVVGRNAFRGPGFLGGDMSLRKNFKITERIGFQLGLNAYNWLNHANYGDPAASTIFGPSFGQVIFTQTPATSPYGSFAAAATDMRMAQITAKLTF